MSEHPEGSSDGPQFNPQSGFPVPPSDPNQPPPPHPQQPYPQQPYPQQPYPQQPYSQQPYPQQGYPGYYQASVGAPELPAANTALIIGLISVVGLFTCFLPVFGSPWAWYYGVKARREIRQSAGRFSGDGKATAGMVLGIIGTVVLALVILFFVLLIVLFAAGSESFFDTGTGTGTGV